MPKVAGRYHAIVREKRVVQILDAESKEAAIRATLIELANRDDLSDFMDWVNGGMEIELILITS